MTTQELKDNRNEIIEMINNKNIFDFDLKVIMTKVSELSQMGCYFEYDSNDMNDIVDTVLEEMNQKESFKVTNEIEETNREISMNCRPSSMR